MIIREAEEQDLDKLVELWYEASLKAYDFIDPKYWEANKTTMRELYLPLSQNWVVGDCDGFVSMMGSEVNALFVSPGQQHKGLGTALVNWAQREEDTLTLNVYARNEKAVQFYEKMGFSNIETSMDEVLNEKQFRMQWVKG